MGFFERVKEIGLPLDSAIVIGSGVLAAHGIREARDVDLVVTTELFDELEKDGSWEKGPQGSSSYALQKGDSEIWRDWSTDGTGHPSYEDLLSRTELIEGIRFVTLDYIVQRKKERGTTKDVEDIRMIHEYKKRER